jgi:hypothetical protein
VPDVNCAGAYGGCDDGPIYRFGSFSLGVWTARDNTVGVVGVAPGVSDADIYVYGACDGEGFGTCPTTEVTAGINSAIFTAKVLDFGLTHQPYDAAQSNAIAQAWNNDIVIIAPVGDLPDPTGNAPGYPAIYSHVIGVSGVKPDRTFAGDSPCVGQDGSSTRSKYGSGVDLAGPYWALSTVQGGYQDQTDGWCGTFVSAAHVAGVAALIRAANPTWTDTQVVAKLSATATGGGQGNVFVGYGVVDAAAAVALAVAIDGPNVVYSNQTQTWNANVSGGASPYTFQWYVNGNAAGNGQALTTNTGEANFQLQLDVTDAASTTRTATEAVTVQLAPPTNCAAEWIRPPANYLRVSWTNSGESGVSTEVWINSNGIWSLVGTVAPGTSLYFYTLGSQTGLFYARVRHVKQGATASDYCNTGAVTVG